MGKRKRKSSEQGSIRARAVGAEESRFPLLFLLLALLAAATFWRVRGNEFISYDDPVYVTSNDAVLRGLTWDNVVWAFTARDAANWHPVTWLSHMADVSLFGLNPSGHHTTNLLLHIANTLLLFLLFRKLTGRQWRSAWIAAVFAVHPAHVESVAWVAERKDLLSALFWLATTLAYVSWVRNRSARRYAVVLVLFAAGLMSKPMLVSLPLVLLLLDEWPLGRFGGANDRPARLIFEKAPLLLMSAASSVVTFLVQRSGGALGTFESFPFWTRVGNALVSYVRYLEILVWPAKLAIFYPHPGASLSKEAILLAALLLVALSAAAVALRRKAPYLFVGWCWFLVTLLPVIGIVQVGLQAMADRYTYVAFIGLLVAIAWGAPAVASRWQYSRFALPAAAAAAVLALALDAAAQVRFWRNSETLYLHALEVTKDNSVALNCLGDYYNAHGEAARALPLLSKAREINPNEAQAHTNIGVSLFLLGRIEEAAGEFSESLRLKPGDPITLTDLAGTRLLQGEIPEAVRLYEAAVRGQDSADLRKRLATSLLLEDKTRAAIVQLRRAAFLAPSDEDGRRMLAAALAFDRDPNDPSADSMRRFLARSHLEASVALRKRGKGAEAEGHLRRALELFPSFAAAHNELGTRLMKKGRWDEAAAEFELSLSLDSGSALAHNNLGYVLFRKGRKGAAIEQYREALRLQPGFPPAQNNLQEALSTPAETKKNGLEKPGEGNKQAAGKPKERGGR